jgi:hypothetical protein
MQTPAQSLRDGEAAAKVLDDSANACCEDDTAWRVVWLAGGSRWQK